MKKAYTYVIAIDDGDCRYEYPITLPNGYNTSILEIYKKICKTYKVEPQDGIWRKSIAREVLKILDND